VGQARASLGPQMAERITPLRFPDSTGGGICEWIDIGAKEFDCQLDIGRWVITKFLPAGGSAPVLL